MNFHVVRFIGALVFPLSVFNSSIAADPLRVFPGDNLQEAIEQSRKLPRPAVLELAAGRYELAAPLTVSAEDHDLTIRGVSAATTRIVGSRKVVGWRLSDPSRGIWEARVPAEFETSSPRAVFWNGERMQRARTPNSGWLETTEKLSDKSPLTMTMPVELLQPGWRDRADVLVVALQKWAGFKLPIQSIDLETRTVVLPGKAFPHRQEAKNRFWIENAPEALDQPGEWYVDRSRKVIRLIPREKSSTPQEGVVTVSAMPALMYITGSKNLELRELTFAEADDDFPAQGEIDVQAAAARRGAIQFKEARSCRVENCVVETVGGYGIDIGRGSRGCVVSRCDLRELGAGGVRIGETGIDVNPAAQVTGHTVEDCRIHHYGRLYLGGVGLIVFQSAENRLTHNEISHAPYSGVSVGWTWGYKSSPCRENLVEGNHIHHLGGKLLSDLGGVYLLGPQPGTVVRENLIHDLECFEYGAWGLYTDEGSTGIVLEKNIVLRTQKAGFHQHFGQENLVRGNLFVDCGEGTVRRTREEDHLSFTFEGNVIVSGDPRLFHSAFKNGKYRFANNLYFSRPKPAAIFGNLPWDKWQASGQDTGSLLADPLLLDSEHPERGFKPESPAFQFGFTMPEMSRIGPRPD